MFFSLGKIHIQFTEEKKHEKPLSHQGFVVFGNTYGGKFCLWLSVLTFQLLTFVWLDWKLSISGFIRKAFTELHYDNKCSTELWIFHSPALSCTVFSDCFFLPMGYISDLSNCVWNVMTANAFSASFSVSRLCFLLLKHVTLFLFTLYLVWQCFEIKHSFWISLI